MTPSVQSQDYTFTMGTAATAEGPQSAMLFTAPKSRPHRVFKPVGPGFGQKLLRPPSSTIDGGLCVTLHSVVCCVWDCQYFSSEWMRFSGCVFF